MKEDSLSIALNVKDALAPQEIGFLVDVGYSTEKGIAVEQDYATALKLYRLCAEAGDVTAINNVGWMLLNGFGVGKDVGAAIEMFERAIALSEQDPDADPDQPQAAADLAMLNLGNIYEGLADTEWETANEEYVDYPKALYWFKRAAENGYVKAIFKYANMIHHGKGIRKNYKKAYDLFLSIKDYDEKVYFYLGLYNQEGFGRPKDHRLAFHYYSMGALLGDAYCYNQLGVMYGKGQYVEKNPEEAFNYYKLAYENGDVLGASNIGWMYETGTFVEKDIQEADRWYALAAAHNEPHALEAISRLGVSVHDDQAAPEGTLRLDSSLHIDMEAPAPADTPEDRLLNESDVQIEDNQIKINRTKMEAILTEAQIKPGKSLKELLMDYMNDRHMQSKEVYDAANIDRKLFSKILSVKNYTPSKTVVLALAIGLRLNVHETENLLAAAGHAFSQSDISDLYIGKFIEHGFYEIHEINEILYERGLPLLGTKV